MIHHYKMKTMISRFGKDINSKVWLLVLIVIVSLFSCAEQKDTKTDTAKESVSNSESQALAYDLNDAEDQFLIFQKLQGDLSGKKIYSYSEGRVFGIRPDRPDSLNVFGKEVFKYSGCSIKISRLLENGHVETKSKGWLLYRDPKTGAFIDEMVNPYTKQKVDVPPFRAGIRGGVNTPNGPKIDATFKMESTVFDAPVDLVFTEIGYRIHVTRHAFTKWFESKSRTWRTEMTLDTYDFDRKYLTDRSYTHIPADFHWTSETSWLSILKMAGTPGHMIWTSSGSTFYNKEELPQEFIKATEKRQSGVFVEPLTWDE